MNKLFFIATLFISSLLVAQSGTKNFIDQNYIEVTGTAEMEIIPDEIYISILLNEADNKIKVAVATLEKQMVKKLENIGIDVSKELMVKDMNSSYKSYLISRDQIHLAKEYQLLVKDGVTASKVFKELEKLGISNMSIDKLDHSKIDEYKKEVKVQAIQAAKEKAQSLALAVDQEVGRAMYIQEQNYHRAYAANTTMNVRSQLSTMESEPELDFEKIKLEYSILCCFELK